MAAVLGRTQIEVKRTGVSATVPNSPTAKLMYYFNCVCACIEPDSDYTIRRLRNYSNYANLSNQEEAQLLVLCLALSPDKLIGSIFFPVADGEDFDGCNNEFFEVNAVSTRLVVAESILIGGQQKKVKKIMMFKKSWIESNYLDPLRSIGRSQRPSPPAIPRSPPPRRNDSSCIIL